jgi:hypothetical protein
MRALVRREGFYVGTAGRRGRTNAVLDPGRRFTEDGQSIDGMGPGLTKKAPVDEVLAVKTCGDALLYSQWCKLWPWHTT